MNDMAWPIVELSSATASWMLNSLLIGGIVVLGALAAHDAQQVANRAVRWVWFSALGMIIALSIVAPFRRSASLIPLHHMLAVRDGGPLLPRTSAETVAATWWSRSRDVLVFPVETALHAVQSTVARVPAPIQRGLAGTWILASLATFFAFAVSYGRIRRQMRRWPTRRVENITARIAPDAGPAVVGLAPAEIILPEWLMACPAAEQRLVIAHECEHVRAGDPWLLVMACGAVACMPWNPALWFALGRLRLAVELDCDRRVLRRGASPSAYGSLLIDLSALRPSLPSAMPAFSCNGSYLERRLVAMTSRPSRFAGSRQLLGALCASVALATACESKLPTSAEVERMDVAALQEKTKQLVLVDSGRTRYLVDGKPVSEAEARDLRASRIGGVVVVKGTGNEMSEIRIVTLDTTAPRIAVSVTGVREARRERDSVPGLSLTASGVRRPRVDSASGGLTTKVNKADGSLSRKFDGLLLIDGRIADASELDRMNPERIASVEVIKGAAAARAYADARAANGVIKVTTKTTP